MAKRVGEALAQEDDFEFVQIRDLLPQWDVLLDGVLFSRVTERVITSPTYTMVRIEEGAEQGPYVSYETRDEVANQLLAWAND